MNDVPRGEVGEIVYRGPTLMAGYWNKPTATEEAFDGGWFHSGDLVREDEEGFLYVVDRKKDMIVSSPADPALEDLTGWTTGRLASYKKPAGPVVLAELPRNASGKVLKHELRARCGGS